VCGRCHEVFHACERHGTNVASWTHHALPTVLSCAACGGYPASMLLHNSSFRARPQRCCTAVKRLGDSVGSITQLLYSSSGLLCGVWCGHRPLKRMHRRVGSKGTAMLVVLCFAGCLLVFKACYHAYQHLSGCVPMDQASSL